MKRYIIKPETLTACEVFAEASREELRVLLALISTHGLVESIDALADVSRTTKSRAASALMLFCEEGVITEASEDGIIDEFEERLTSRTITEELSIDVAKSIRDENLSALLEECADIMGKPTLTNPEIKSISALVTQYSLSVEYIAILCQNMKKASSRFTVQKLVNKAISLSERGIDCAERLEQYLIEAERMSPAAYEYCRALGIYRKPSERELEYFERWDKEFGYSVEIIKEAFGITTINTAKTSFRYMDRILSDWHAAGCKTVEECRRHSESRPKSDSAAQKRAKSVPEKPRYGDFDVEDAFAKALKRSYGTDTEEK